MVHLYSVGQFVIEELCKECFCFKCEKITHAGILQSACGPLWWVVRALD